MLNAARHYVARQALLVAWVAWYHRGWLSLVDDATSKRRQIYGCSLAGLETPGTQRAAAEGGESVVQEARTTAGRRPT